MNEWNMEDLNVEVHQLEIGAVRLIKYIHCYDANVRLHMMSVNTWDPNGGKTK